MTVKTKKRITSKKSKTDDELKAKIEEIKSKCNDADSLSAIAQSFIKRRSVDQGLVTLADAELTGVTAILNDVHDELTKLEKKCEADQKNE